MAVYCLQSQAVVDTVDNFPDSLFLHHHHIVGLLFDEQIFVEKTVHVDQMVNTHIEDKGDKDNQFVHM